MNHICRKQQSYTLTFTPKVALEGDVQPQLMLLYSSHVASKYLDVRAFTVGLHVQARAVLHGHGATGL